MSYIDALVRLIRPEVARAPKITVSNILKFRQV